ncbi:hypothetical protein Tco_1486859 [Tanacetum coccineum]
MMSCHGGTTDRRRKEKRVLNRSLEAKLRFSQILIAIRKSRTPTPKLDASTFAITTRSGTSTHDLPYPTPPRPTTVDHTEGTVAKGVPKGEEPTVIWNEETT